MKHHASTIRLAGFVAVLIGKAFGQAALLLYGMVVARIATPEAFALYSIVITIVLLLDAFFGAPIDYCVIRFSALHAGDHDRSDRLQAAAFRLKLVIGLCIGLVLALIGPRAAGLLRFDTADVGLISIVAGLTTILLLNRSIAAYFQSRLQFRSYSLLDMAHSALRILAIVTLFLSGATGAEAYCLGLLLAGTTLLLASLCWIPGPFLTVRSPRRDDVAEASRFLGVTTTAILLGTVTGRTDLIFLTHHASSGGIAEYAIAGQLASIATLVASYASVVTQTNVIPAILGNRAHRLLSETLLLGALAAVLFVSAIWVAGDLVVATLFGQKYQDAGAILRILSVGTAVDLLSMPVAMTILLQTRPRLYLSIEIVITISFLALVWPVAALGPAAMAYLVTVVRLAKGILYVGVVATLLRRTSFRDSVAAVARG